MVHLGRLRLLCDHQLLPMGGIFHSEQHSDALLSSQLERCRLDGRHVHDRVAHLRLPIFLPDRQTGQ